MKYTITPKVKLFFSIAMICITCVSSATIRRVNNTGILTAPAPPNAIPVYTTAQAAHDAAISGDTIYIEPSGVNYGNLNISKQLTIVGNGYLLGALIDNKNPGLQAWQGSSLLTTITFSAGSSNTTLTGITATGNINISSSVNNVVIKRNYLAGVVLTTTSTVNNGLILAQNYISGLVQTASGACINFQIANNLILAGLSLGAPDNGIIEGNFIAGSFGAQNSLVRNNITNAASVILPGCIIENNIGTATQFGNSNGNQQNIVMTTVFVDFNNGSALYSEDNRFALSVSSPAAGTGWNGTDIGPILRPANANNTMSKTYVPSGIPSIPTVFSLSAPSQISGSTMNVNLSTKSNN